MVFYQRSISVTDFGGRIPLSPIRAKFFLSKHGVNEWSYRKNGDFGCMIYEVGVDISKSKMKFPTENAIEANFAKGVLFEFKKDKDKHKLISLLENAYHSFKKREKF